MRAAVADELTDSERDLLDRIADDDVTYVHRGNAGTSYRVWSSEHDYETCTKPVARLIDLGLARRASGYRITSGPVQLTEAGGEARG